MCYYIFCFHLNSLCISQFPLCQVKITREREFFFFLSFANCHSKEQNRTFNSNNFQFYFSRCLFYIMHHRLYIFPCHFVKPESNIYWFCVLFFFSNVSRIYTKNPHILSINIFDIITIYIQRNITLIDMVSRVLLGINE